MNADVDSNSAAASFFPLAHGDKFEDKKSA
jgi:hypothetical protein